MKILLLALVGFGLVGCTYGQHISDTEDTWYADQTQFGFYQYSELYYCRANKSGDGVKPTCYEAKKISPRQ